MFTIAYLAKRINEPDIRQCMDILLRDPAIDPNLIDKFGQTALWAVVWASQSICGLKAILASHHLIRTDITYGIRNTVTIFDVATAPIRELLKRYEANPTQCRFDLQVEEGRARPSATILFVDVVMVSDGQKRLRDEVSSKAARFYRICARLPMEVQMVVCNRVHGIVADAISGAQVELALRHI